MLAFCFRFATSVVEMYVRVTLVAVLAVGLATDVFGIHVPFWVSL